MTSETETRLTPFRRLARGLAYTAVGPIDVTRGAVGLTAQSVAATAAALTRNATRPVRLEIAGAQKVASTLVVAAEASTRRRRRLIVFGAAGVATLAGGAVLFSIVRRSRQPEPTALQPSVSVAPKP